MEGEDLSWTFIVIDLFFCDRKANTEFLFLTVADNPNFRHFGAIVSNLERFKDNLKTSLIETGLSYSESSDLTFEIIITTKDKVQTDRMNHYYTRYYWDNYYFRDDIRTITENILRVNLKDNTADKTLWTVVTVWRNGSSKAPTSEDGSNIIVDEIMLSFL